MSKVKMVIGGVLVLSVFLATYISSAQDNTLPPIQSPTGIRGRYEIIINPKVRADTFLLDTETGKIWERIQYTDRDDVVIWSPVLKADSNTELNYILDGTPIKQPDASQQPQGPIKRRR